jgi:acetyl esterase/lipase
MKPIVLLVCTLTASALAEDLSAIRQQVEQQVATLPVVAHFDQPYAGPANPKQMLDLYLPKTRKSDKPLPVIVYIHGGAWKSGDRIKSANNVLRFVQTGDYAGISVSYRLSDEAQWPAQIFDCKAAIRWVRAHAKEHGLDPERIGVWGGSAGGHLCSLLGTTGGVKELEGDLGPHTAESSRVTCVVNQCGPQDFTMPLMFRDGQPVMEDVAVAGLLGGKLAENREKVLAASPVTYVTPDDAPFLTLHGTKDERVDFKHAERIDAALKNAGVPSLLIPVTEGGHGFHNPQLAGRVGAFFARHLRGMKVEIPTEPLPDMKPAR